MQIVSDRSHPLVHTSKKIRCAEVIGVAHPITRMQPKGSFLILGFIKVNGILIFWAFSSLAHLATFFCMKTISFSTMLISDT